jgi:hypothetical protein
MASTKNEYLVETSDFVWTDNYAFMRQMTCRNHRGARYLTKNPGSRGLHFVEADPTVKVGEGNWMGECPCEYGDLMVVIHAADDCERCGDHGEYMGSRVIMQVAPMDQPAWVCPPCAAALVEGKPFRRNQQA